MVKPLVDAFFAYLKQNETKAPKSGKTSSVIIYSIAETAKANDLKPFAYFEYLLTEIPKHVEDKSTDFLTELLPWSASLPEHIRKPKKAVEK